MMLPEPSVVELFSINLSGYFRVVLQFGMTLCSAVLVSVFYVHLSFKASFPSTFEPPGESDTCVPPALWRASSAAGRLPWRRVASPQPKRATVKTETIGSSRSPVHGTAAAQRQHSICQNTVEFSPTKLQSKMKRRTNEDLCLKLGWWEGETFHIKNHCLDLLKAIEEELGCEDPILHTTRKLITSSKAIQSDILPVLIHSQENPCIFRAVLRVLLRLTTPVECLIPMDLALQSKTAMEAIQNLHMLLLETKRSFLDIRSTETIMRVLKAKMKTDQEPKDLTENDLEGLSNSLVLMRNLLHVPDKTESSRFGITEDTFEDWLSVHNKLIWNLFVHGLDGVLILMLNSVYKVNWAVIVVQIIALLYKDQGGLAVQSATPLGAREPRLQDVGNLQHLISTSTSNSESSEDDIESNTSKHSVHHASSNDSMQPGQPCGGSGTAKNNRISCNGGIGGAGVATSGGLANAAGGSQSTAGDSGYCHSDFTTSSSNSRSFSPRDKGELSRDASSSSGRASADNMTSSSNGHSSSSDDENQASQAHRTQALIEKL
ncbi:hypothetical protein HPB49_004282 [Dermacentor silvarum]|uniref:Uncharacterized protein n=1 Tax=Dermacentor silvarum TaxID=543639 RepID=A0ACB8DB73_DERSI|nr:hypothetical protein HPB49_004282 [Dermacentor silvarum]